MRTLRSVRVKRSAPRCCMYGRSSTFMSSCSCAALARTQTPRHCDYACQPNKLRQGASRDSQDLSRTDTNPGMTYHA